MIEQMGGRKFVLTVLLMVLGSIMVLTDKIDAMQYLTFCAVNFVTYSAANVASKYKNEGDQTGTN